MRIILIRHAESTNNIIEDEIRLRIKQGKIPHGEEYKEFVTRRHHDPFLSPKGYQQADALGAAYGHLEASGLSIYSSAVRRALETAAPLAKKIGAPVTVMPDLYEVGGIYCNPHTDHMRHEPAAGMTSQEIVTAFPFMNVSNLPAKGPWNQMKPFDDGAADARRAVSVAAWLLSPEFIEQHRKKSVLIVTHSEFMDLLTKALMNPLLFAVESGNFTHTRDLARLGHAFQNTSLTHFAISPSKQPQQRPHVRMLYLNRVDHLPQTLGGLIDNGRAKL